jgi:CubicO group peptidase (beta-lactamase class C family)
VSGQSYYDFVKSPILEPLGIYRTFFKTPSKDVDAVTLCYNTLDDATSVRITCPKLGDD